MRISRLVTFCLKKWIWLTVAVVYLVIFTKTYLNRQNQVTIEVLVKMPTVGSLDNTNFEGALPSLKDNYYDAKNKSTGTVPLEQHSVHQQRRNTLKKTCNATWRGQHKLHVTDGGLRNHFSIDQKNGLVYCGIPKVGSTFWKRVLQITSGKKKMSNPFDISARSAHDGTLEQFHRQSFDQIHHILFSSTKFLFVREPYSRLFSCYVDKVFTPRPAYLHLRKHILEVSKGKPSGNATNSTCPVHVTFSDFVKFVIYSLANGKWTDYHFLPMYDMCRPCEVQYDIVGKMETFMDDAKFVLQQKGLENIIELNQERSDSDAIIDIVDSVFAERQGIEKGNCVSFGQGLSIVWKKAIIRGILSKDEIMPQKFLNEGGVTKEDFKHAMDEAYARSTNKAGRLNNRKEALVEAFKGVSKADLNKYHELFRPDFDIFGYEIEPADIFSANRSSQGHSFFS